VEKLKDQYPPPHAPHRAALVQLVRRSWLASGLASVPVHGGLTCHTLDAWASWNARRWESLVGWVTRSIESPVAAGAEDTSAPTNARTSVRLGGSSGSTKVRDAFAVVRVFPAVGC
jgi:hypothetical protein